MNYNILIIDDDFTDKTRNRIETYEYLLEKDENELYSFTPSFCHPKELHNISTELQKAHLVIIDMFLEGDKTEDADIFIYQGENMIDFIRDNRPDIPVFGVTEHWPLMGKGNNGRKLFDYNLVGGASWGALATQQSSLRYNFFRYIEERTQTSIKLDPNEAINILHLGDFQFGGEWSGDGKPQDKYNKCMFDISNEIKHSVHLLFVTGDFCQHGKPSQFEEAYTYLTQLSETLSIPKHCRYIVPGNHDVSFPLQLSSKIQFDGENPASLEKDDIDSDLQKFILGPYISFANAFMGDSHFDINTGSNSNFSKFFYRSEKFKDHGFEIIGINTVNNLSCDDMTTPSIGQAPINELKKQLKKSTPGVKLVLMHHPPINMRDDYLSEDAEQLKDVFYKDSPLFILGHTHGGKPKMEDTSTIDDSKSSIFIPVGTPSLVKKKEDTLRGFNIISLLRTDGIINGVDITMYKYEINAFTHKTYHYKLDQNGEWQKGGIQ